MSKHIIYRITHTQNGKQYIGQTSRGLDRRVKKHWSDVKQGRPTYLHAAMRKYGKDAFTYEILEDLGPEATDADLNEKETYWIKKLKTYGNGYNLTEGGGGMRGYVMSEESRAKISESLKGKTLPKETRAKMSAARKGEKNPNFGKTCSDETRAKLSAAKKGKGKGEKNPNFGKTPSDETRAKLSAALKGRSLTPESIAKREATKRQKREQPHATEPIPLM